MLKQFNQSCLINFEYMPIDLLICDYFKYFRKCKITIVYIVYVIVTCTSASFFLGGGGREKKDGIIINMPLLQEWEEMASRLMPISRAAFNKHVICFLGATLLAAVSTSYSFSAVNAQLISFSSIFQVFSCTILHAVLFMERANAPLIIVEYTVCTCCWYVLLILKYYFFFHSLSKH